MERYSEGDCIRVDIPDETDPDHDQYHGKHGTVVTTLEDQAGEVTGNETDGIILRVELETGEKVDFRMRDLRPPLE